MTVIAWDGKTLAADRRCTTSWGAHDSVTKIWRVNDCLVAISGKPAIGLRMLHWWQTSADPEKFPSAAAVDDGATLIVICMDGRVLEYTTGPIPAVNESERPAWGSGRDFARAAMHSGQTAEQSVSLACELCVFCGNGIDTLTLEQTP
jgi:hypothetical protein